MMWECRNINVVEQAKIPKFSQLDDIGTPLRHFELFSNDELVDMIVGYTKFYGHRKKADTSFEITNVPMLLLSGFHKLPECKMYFPQYFCTSNMVSRGFNSPYKN